MTTTISTPADIEAAARADYEAARKRSKGLPAWEDLNPADANDMGMKERAYVTVTEPLTEHPEGWDGPCMCALCLSYADAE